MEQDEGLALASSTKVGQLFSTTSLFLEYVHFYDITHLIQFKLPLILAQVNISDERTTQYGDLLATHVSKLSFKVNLYLV